MATKFWDKSAIVLLVLSALVSCDKDKAPGPKTEQAAGAAMMSIGAAVTPIKPEVGLPMMGVGAGLMVHGHYREE